MYSIAKTLYEVPYFFVTANKRLMLNRESVFSCLYADESACAKVLSGTAIAVSDKGERKQASRLR